MDDVGCARIPRDSLAVLARLRITPGLRVALLGDHAWLRWEAGDQAVLSAVLPIHGVELFSFRDGRWHRFGSSLPDFGFPHGLEYQPIAHALFPGAVQPIADNGSPRLPLRMTLRRDDEVRPATAMRCTLDALLAWSDTVGAGRLTKLQGVVQRGEALIMGSELPFLVNARRYWGVRVVVPLGYLPEPALTEGVLLQAAGVDSDCVMVLESSAMEIIERSRFSPLSRAGIRLAQREARR